MEGSKVRFYIEANFRLPLDYCNLASVVSGRWSVVSGRWSVVSGQKAAGRGGYAGRGYGGATGEGFGPVWA